MLPMAIVLLLVAAGTGLPLMMILPVLLPLIRAVAGLALMP